VATGVTISSLAVSVAMDDVPIQYFQSVIAIELAVTGALLFQIRYFAPRNQAEEDLPDPLLRLAVAVVLGATLFGSLEAMLHGGDKIAAAAVMIGLAVSLLPILLRVLPPLRREAENHERRSDVAVTIAGVLLYVVLVVAALILIAA
jgi:hypothetical protein